MVIALCAKLDSSIGNLHLCRCQIHFYLSSCKFSVLEIVYQNTVKIDSNAVAQFWWTSVFGAAVRAA